MQYSDLPLRIDIPFARDAGIGFINPIPDAASGTPGKASFPTGFVPANFSQPAAGGVPPWGADFNGLLNQMTAWTRWQSAGGMVQFDAAFATAIGGYPKWAMIASSVAGQYYVNLVENNTAAPPTNWSLLSDDALLSITTAQTISGTFADARISLSSVQQYQSSLIIPFANITSFPGDIAATANTYVLRDSVGDGFVRYVNTAFGGSFDNDPAAVFQIAFWDGTTGYLRHGSLTHVAAAMLTAGYGTGPTVPVGGFAFARPTPAASYVYGTNLAGSSLVTTSGGGATGATAQNLGAGTYSCRGMTENTSAANIGTSWQRVA